MISPANKSPNEYVDSPRAPQSKGDWRDSPWFWLGAFCLVGAFGATMMSGKYTRRQGILQRRADTREMLAASGTPDTEQYDANNAPQPALSLAPIIFLLVGSGSLGWLIWRRKATAQAQADELKSP